MSRIAFQRFSAITRRDCDRPKEQIPHELATAVSTSPLLSQFALDLTNGHQVQRRLRAMLTDLVETLPARRAGILTAESTLLASSSKRTFQDIADQNLAEAGDLQGIGGSYEDYEQ